MIQEDSEEQEEPLCLRVVEIHDEKDKLTAKYEYEFDIEGEKFVESVTVSAKFGLNPSSNLVVC